MDMMRVRVVLLVSCPARSRRRMLSVISWSVSLHAGDSRILIERGEQTCDKSYKKTKAAASMLSHAG